MGLDNPLHIMFLLVLLLLVFGAKRLPEMGRSLGTGLRGFKDSLSGLSLHAEAQGPAARLPVAAVPAVPAEAAEQPVPAVPAPPRP